MVDFKKLSTQAKDLVEKRGGTEALKKDAAQLQEIAKSKGSMSDKAKAAAAALKQPGSEPVEAAAAAPPADPGPKPDPAAPTPLGNELDAEAAARKAKRRKGKAEGRVGGDDPAA